MTETMIYINDRDIEDIDFALHYLVDLKINLGDTIFRVSSNESAGPAVDRTKKQVKALEYVIDILKEMKKENKE